MSGGGGSSSSSASTTSTTAVDARQVIDGQSQGISGNGNELVINTTTLDGGAVEQSINLVAGAGAAALDAYKSLLAVTLAFDKRNGEAEEANRTLASELVASGRDVNLAATEAAKTSKIGAETTQEKTKQLIIGGLILGGIMLYKAK